MKKVLIVAAIAMMTSARKLSQMLESKNHAQVQEESDILESSFLAKKASCINNNDCQKMKQYFPTTDFCCALINLKDINNPTRDIYEVGCIYTS